MTAAPLPAVSAIILAGGRSARFGRDKLTVSVYGVTMKDGNTFRHTIEFEAWGTSTHLRKRFESLKLNLISKLTLPLGALVVPRMVAADVVRIKARLEQPA